MQSYLIRSPYWLIQDTPHDPGMKRLDLHVSQGDVFPYLATLAGFLNDANDAQSREELVTELRSALIHLHEKYALIPSARPVSYTKAASVRF